MALLATPTYQDIFQVNFTSRKCFAKRVSCQEPLCNHQLSVKSISDAKGILGRRISYLPGDKAMVDKEIEQLAGFLIRSGSHGKGKGPQLVEALVKELHEQMKQHFENRKIQDRAIAVSEPTSTPENISVTHPSCTETSETSEINEASKTSDFRDVSEVSEVTYPALATTHAFVIEDKEEVIDESSNEPHPLLHSNNTQPHSVTKSPTPLPNKVSVAPDPVSTSLPLPSNPLLSLVINILQQMLVGVFSSVQARRGVVPVENKSGKTENKSVVDFKIMLGLRLATGMVPIFLCVIVVGLYYQAWRIIGTLVSYVLVSVTCVLLWPRISLRSEVAV